MGTKSGLTKKIAPCREACPAGIDVPRYIRMIRQRDFDRALAVIRERIPFPAVCGYACVHPCEAKCARIQYDEAVSIRMLKRAADEHSRGVVDFERKAKTTGKRVAVIGSGPCGLTAAHYLAGLGHAVTVFESLSQAGGMLRYGIPEYRLPNAVVDHEIAAIQSRGVEIVTLSPVSSAPELLGKGYDAVLVASGAWKPLKMGIEGEESSQVIDGIAFLKDVNRGTAPPIGKKVVVVGGGNSAIDAARTGIRMGAKVTLLYRRTREEMPASPEEVAEAEEEGVKIEFLAAPVRIRKGGAICIRMTPGPRDDSGRPRPIPVAGSEFSISCNTVIMAVGQRADAGMLRLPENRSGAAMVDPELATPVPGIFAAGDAVTGPKTIIDAIAQGRTVSAAIDRYLGGDGRIDPVTFSPEQSGLPEEKPMGTKRPKPRMLPLKLRKRAFDPVESGYDQETAVSEAERCLACDIRRYLVEVNPAICKECGYCQEMCHMGIFATSDTFNAGGYKPSVVQHSDRCVGCLKCLYVCPDFAITIQEGQPNDLP
ncbi:MAG: FAD-dependent oxidoreductase [Syntrophales bacterium]|nr:FAD-dependent oxidoreductase [Syntrophales bacterium]